MKTDEADSLPPLPERGCYRIWDITYSAQRLLTKLTVYVNCGKRNSWYRLIFTQKKIASHSIFTCTWKYILHAAFVMQFDHYRKYDITILVPGPQT